MSLLWDVDVFFDRELHCFHDEACAVLDADSEIVGEQVCRKFRLEGPCNVCGDDASDCCWYA